MDFNPQDFVDGELCQPVQFQFDDGVDLRITEAECVPRPAASISAPPCARYSGRPVSRPRIFFDFPFSVNGDVLLAEY